MNSKKTVENSSVPVHHQLNNTALENIKENAQLSLRDHRDDSNYYESMKNSGNFQKLLEFRVDSGDKILEK